MGKSEDAPPEKDRHATGPDEEWLTAIAQAAAGHEPAPLELGHPLRAWNGSTLTMCWKSRTSGPLVVSRDGEPGRDITFVAGADLSLRPL
jgi:hypothetical protein